MDIPLNTDLVLEVKLSGKFAHFRKFYTNASSLTYTIPPRTTICGILASILQIPRDEYYDLMSSDKLGIAISLKNNNYLKIFQTLNYAADKSKKTPINDLSVHKQCRLELLKAQGDKNLEWLIFLCFNGKQENSFLILKEKIQKRDFGYGISLGQKQFLANLEYINSYANIQFIPESNYIDSAINMEQIKNLDNENYDLIMERMPLEQELIEGKGKSYRQTKRFGNIVIETNGKRITGKFKDLVEIHNDRKARVSFL